MTDDLVKRLRELRSKQYADPNTAPEFVFLDPDFPPKEWEEQYAMDVIYVRADRIEELEKQNASLEAKLAVAISEMENIDAYLTRLQTPNTEPLNSVNSCGNKKGRGQYTAMVRNEAREFWASLGNTLANIKGEQP